MHAAVHASFTLSFVSGQQRKCVDAARSEDVSCLASRHRRKTTRSNQSDLSPAVGSRWKERALCSVTCSILVLSITACAIQETPQQRAQRIEPILAAAGFNMIPADSDNKKTIVSSLAPLKLHYYIGKDGKRIGDAHEILEDAVKVCEQVLCELGILLPTEARIEP